MDHPITYSDVVMPPKVRVGACVLACKQVIILGPRYKLALVFQYIPVCRVSLSLQVANQSAILAIREHSIWSSSGPTSL